MKSLERHIGGHPWENRLSEYLDDELTGAERRELEDHLRACAACAAVLEELQGVVSHAARGALEAEPSRDLWEGIERRLRPRLRGPVWRRALEALRPREAGPGRWRVPAFAAAAVLVLAALVSVVWLRGGGVLLPPHGPYRQAARPASPAGSRAPSEVVAPLEAGREYYDTIAELRRAVDERLTHDPRVVEVLDGNLAALDAAIAGYRDALAADPGDEALARRLEEARHRKVEVLRQAVALASEANN